MQSQKSCLKSLILYLILYARKYDKRVEDINFAYFQHIITVCIFVLPKEIMVIFHVSKKYI